MEQGGANRQPGNDEVCNFALARFVGIDNFGHEHISIGEKIPSCTKELERNTKLHKVQVKGRKRAWQEDLQIEASSPT